MIQGLKTVTEMVSGLTSLNEMVQRQKSMPI